MSNELLEKMRQYGLTMNSLNSVASCYLMSDLVLDYPFYDAITKGVSIRSSAEASRASGDRVRFPLRVCPLGRAKGDMTHWAYVHKRNLGKKERFNAFTLELGTGASDGFYPNKFQMVDIVYNGCAILRGSLENFNRFVRYGANEPSDRFPVG